MVRLLVIGAGLCLIGCSLSIENPEADARKKLEKVVPTSLSLLTGRWDADSTFTVDDTRASTLDRQGIFLEILADTTYSRQDPTHTVFAANSGGRARLSGDTLFITPETSAPDTFVVRLRFLGNYLELDHPADQRFTFFHKRKPVDSLALRTALADSLWRYQGNRGKQGTFHAESFAKDFRYLRFRGDSMWMDDRVDGVIRIDSGEVEREDSLWTWKASGGTRDFLFDLIADDSLRLWPLADGHPDSGYHLYRKFSTYHSNDIDMRRLLGHLRSDSIRYPKSTIENHYGRYYDLILGEDHSVGLETDMDSLPAFDSWSLDSGTLDLKSAAAGTTRFRVDTTGGKVKLSADSGKAFGRSATLFLTRIDPESFRTNPLERFQEASYFQLVVAGDTTFRFFNTNQSKDNFEIAEVVDTSVYWTAIHIDAAQETYQSSQAGFFFAFEDRNSGLGRFTCKSDPAKGLVVRRTGAADESLVRGLIQGACRILSADSSFADSALEINGAFRLKRKSAGALASPLWNLR